MEQSKRENEFFCTDLHVHTPSSHDYIGPKNDEEYLEILRRYNSKGIKVIAITDHNTIKGYQKIISIKEKLQAKLKFLEEYITDPNLEKLKEDFDNTEKDIKLFENMLIIPGIEFEAKPGIHMILLFDPLTESCQIERFIEESGYTLEIQGASHPDITCNIDVIDLISIAEQLGAYVIAPHADSNKGIYQDTQGIYRAQIFRSNQLIAVSYNNPASKDRIMEMLQNKEYSRSEPLAFIQSSDYHGGDLNDRKIFLKLSSLTFEDVINALKNPNEKVSLTSDPEVTHILTKIIEDRATLLFKDFTNIDVLQASASAILNMGYGYLAVGIDPNKKSIQGIKTDQNISDLVNSIFSIIKPVIKPEITIFPFGDREVIVLLLRNTGGHLYYLSDIDLNKTFIVKDKKVVEATPEDVEKIVEARLLFRLEVYQKKQQDKIIELVKEIKYFGETISQFKIIKKVEKDSQLLASIVKVEVVSPYSSNDDQLENWNGIGCSNGNAFIITKTEPRIKAIKQDDDSEESYLRFIAPSLEINGVDSLNVKKFTGNAMVICSGGGTYIIRCETEWCILAIEESAIVIQIEENEFLNYKVLLAWLKSSVFLWHCITALGDIDIHKPETFKKVRIPYLDNCVEVQKIVDKIIEEEMIFLDKYGDSKSGSFDEHIKEHNNKVNTLIMEIDNTIAKGLKLGTKELSLIIDYLIDKGIYCLSKKNMLKTKTISEND